MSETNARPGFGLSSLECRALEGYANVAGVASPGEVVRARKFDGLALLRIDQEDSKSALTWVLHGGHIALSELIARVEACGVKVERDQ